MRRPRPLRRDRGECLCADRIDARPARHDAHTPDRAHRRDAGRLGAQPARLRALGSRLQAAGPLGLVALPASEPAKHLESDCTIGIDEPAGMLADARRLAAEGFRVLKVKAHDESVVDTVRTIASGRAGHALHRRRQRGLVARAIEARRAGARRARRLAHRATHCTAATTISWKATTALCRSTPTRAAPPAPTSSVSRRATTGINIKLDKAGGLTEALAMARSAKALGMGVMVGCNGATSLGLAPAYVLGRALRPSRSRQRGAAPRRPPRRPALCRQRRPGLDTRLLGLMPAKSGRPGLGSNPPRSHHLGDAVAPDDEAGDAPRGVRERFPSRKGRVRRTGARRRHGACGGCCCACRRWSTSARRPARRRGSRSRRRLRRSRSAPPAPRAPGPQGGTTRTAGRRKVAQLDDVVTAAGRGVLKIEARVVS